MSDTQQPRRLSDWAAQQLLGRIHSGELPVGARLPSEPQMATDMGISRGILREALNTLQAKGYISRTPRGGSFICSTNDSDIGSSITTRIRAADLGDLVEFREAMESKAAVLAIERANDDEIASLRALLDQDVDKAGSIDYYFHYRLAEISGNPLFMTFLDMYYDTIHQYAEGSYKDEARMRVMRREHARIVEALEKRDKRAAVAAIKGHLKNLMRRASGDWDVYV